MCFFFPVYMVPRHMSPPCGPPGRVDVSIHAATQAGREVPFSVLLGAERTRILPRDKYTSR